jgi:hypothetical protein
MRSILLKFRLPLAEISFRQTSSVTVDTSLNIETFISFSISILFLRNIGIIYSFIVLLLFLSFLRPLLRGRIAFQHCHSRIAYFHVYKESETSTIQAWTRLSRHYVCISRIERHLRQCRCHNWFRLLDRCLSLRYIQNAHSRNVHPQQVSKVREKGRDLCRESLAND